jgi:hypothetical protein
VVVGLVRQDLEAVAVCTQTNFDLAGRMRGIALHTLHGHAESFHRLQHLCASGVSTDAGHQHRRQPEAAQVPGNVERGAAEDLPVGKPVHQHLAEQQHGCIYRGGVCGCLITHACRHYSQRKNSSRSPRAVLTACIERLNGRT